ncbi:MAG: aminoacyl-tRNA hydrolase [Minisyncoccia bacterium]
MKYIIGLGNPGLKYKYTRHNVAWLVFDALGLSDWKHDKYMNADFTGDAVADELSLYVKPQTFMNKSGEVIATMKKQDDFNHENVVIMYDDVDLLFGQVRVSYNRGDGGHNGVKSITQHIGTKKTIRIRIGVSRLLDDGRLIKPNVLSKFPDDELSEINNTIAPKIEKIIRSLVQHGVDKTMGGFNTK